MPFWSIRKAHERDLARELQAHLDLEAEEQRAGGLSADDANFAAQRAFGNVSLTKENVRAVWGWSWIEGLIQDLRYAFPWFARNSCVHIRSCNISGIRARCQYCDVSRLSIALLLKELPVPEFLVASSNWPSTKTAKLGTLFFLCP